MGRLKTYNDDVISENYHTYGIGQATARDAFHSIENATKNAVIDLSIAAFLTPWEENGKVRASVLDGEQELIWKNGILTTDNLRSIDLDVPESYGGKLNSILLDGGGNETHESVLNSWTYFMCGNSSAQLGRILKADFSGEGAGKFLRDYTFAKKCAAIPDEQEVHLLYRERDGIKKIFGCFVKEPHFLLFDEILDCVGEVSENTGKDFYVEDWDIFQKMRKLAFKDEEGNKLTFTWADSIINIPGVTYKGNVMKVKDEAELAPSVMELVAA